VILWTTRPSALTLTDPSIDSAGRVSFSGDGRRLLVADQDGIALFDVAKRARTAQLPLAGEAAITPDGRTLAAGGAGSVIALYDLDSRQLVAKLSWAPEGLLEANYGVQISSDGRWLIEKSQAFRWLDKARQKGSFKEQVLVVWDLPQRRKVAELRAGPSAFYGGDNDADVALSQDGRLLAYARDDAVSTDPARRLDRVAVYDLANRREVGVFDTSEEVHSLAFHPAGVLAVGYEDRIELRDTGSLALRQTLRSPRFTTVSLSFSPDGRWLATIGSEGAYLWEVGDPSTVPVLAGALVDSDEGSLSFDTDVAFSPDGRLLAVADGAPEVTLWDLDERNWRETLCQLVDRDFGDAERRRFFPGGQAEPTCGS
jgi:WD40 repeat protein